MKTPTLLLPITLFSIAAMANQSPYAGQENRPIKALSDTQVQAYLAGSGMGYAKAAELNKYPGPKHVLELADQLALSDEQILQTHRLFESMHARAVSLGRSLVEQERDLNTLFSSGAITPESLKERVDGIAMLDAEIRFVHLNAHLAQRKLLTDVQAAKYDELRGYGHPHHSRQH